MAGRMDKEVKWLIGYVLLSRVRGLDRLASVGLTPNIRSIIEGGPPDAFVGNFDRLFKDNGKLSDGVRTALKWRQYLGWPMPVQTP